MLRRAGFVFCFLLAFAFFNLRSHAELQIGAEDVPFVLGTFAEYAQNSNMFAWSSFDTTATMWDLTTHPGEQTATVRFLQVNQGSIPAPDTFITSDMVELDTLGDGSETWTYMSKDSFHLYADGVDFVAPPYRFIGNYQPDAQVYFFPMYYGSGWITAWTWNWLIDGWLAYSANEIHQKQIVAKGWVKTEVTGDQYWPCLVIRDSYTFTDNFGTNDVRWLYEWVVPGRFAGGNGLAAALSTNGASKDFVIVDKMLRMKSLNIPGWNLSLPEFDSTTVWTDTTFMGPFPVSSIITDDEGVGADSLFYRINSGGFSGVGHDSVQGDKYFFTIPVAAVPCTISYYLWAMDDFSVVNGIDIWQTDPEAAPENNIITFIVGTVGIEELRAESKTNNVLSVYPNPFSSSVRIRATGVHSMAPGQMKVFDQSGRLVRSFDVEGPSVEISWSGTDDRNGPLPSGMYFLTFDEGSGLGKSHTVKLIKIR